MAEGKKLGILNTKITLIIGVITILGFLSSGVFYLNSYVAKASDIIAVTAKIEKNKDMIEYNRMQRAYDDIRSEYYKLKKLVKDNPLNEKLQEELDEIKDDKNELKRRLNVLKNKLGL